MGLNEILFSMKIGKMTPNYHKNVTVTYGNCPSYTRDDSSHLTGPWLAMVGGERHIKNAMGVYN